MPMLIDSGSDNQSYSPNPRTSIDELEVEIDPNAGYELEGFDGRTTVARAVTLELVFVKRSFGGKYVIVDSGMGILGRDVLNHIAILLDGPHLSWHEHTNSSK